MSVTSDSKGSVENHLIVHGPEEPENIGTPSKEDQTKSAPNLNQKRPQEKSFKSLKYSNEIQTIFPMKHLKTTWEEDLKHKYRLVEDKNWDKGFKVWRSLPMQSELEQKINVHDGPLKRSSDFTRKSKPEAYLPGFSARKAGPISRPRELMPIRKIPVVKREVKKKREVTESREDELKTSRRESGTMLQDGILKPTQII